MSAPGHHGRQPYASPYYSLGSAIAELRGAGIGERELFQALAEGELPASGVFIQATDKPIGLGLRPFLLSKIEQSGEAIPISRDWWARLGLGVTLHPPAASVLTREIGDKVEFITNIRIKRTDIDRLWPVASIALAEPVSASAKRRGAYNKLDWDALKLAIEYECKTRGYPDDDGPSGWRGQADVERFAASWIDARGESAGESTIRGHVKAALDDIRGQEANN